MKHIVMLKTELSVEERNLLSVAYKNMIGARRASWRTVSSLEQKEMEKKEDTVDKRRLGVITSYRKVIEGELTEICTDVLKLLDEFLLPSSSSKENLVFFHKL